MQDVHTERAKQPYKDEIEDPDGSRAGCVSEARLWAIQAQSLLCVLGSVRVDHHMYLHYPSSATDLQPEPLPSHAPDEGI